MTRTLLGDASAKEQERLRAELVTPEPDARPADAEGKPKGWLDPYRALVTSNAKGFECGEDRRIKQMMFRFKEKPEQAVIDRLKEVGFKYRVEEKTWTIQVTPATRELAINLAREWAGIENTPGR